MMSITCSALIRRGFGAVAGLRRFFLGSVVLVVGLGGCTIGEVPPEDEPPAEGRAEAVAAEITQMLQASAASWNAGDLDGFLDDYWRSDELTFSGGTGITRGWEDVRERYLRSYWAPGAARDSLRFEDLEVTVLGDDHALALGRYLLFRPEAEGSVTNTGYFSLVLRRVEDGWRIVHDHTSPTPPEDGEG
jgi:ketosteroid isomerase-like protein